MIRCGLWLWVSVSVSARAHTWIKPSKTHTRTQHTIHEHISGVRAIWKANTMTMVTQSRSLSRNYVTWGSILNNQNTNYNGPFAFAVKCNRLHQWTICSLNYVHAVLIISFSFDFTSTISIPWSVSIACIIERPRRRQRRRWRHQWRFVMGASHEVWILNGRCWEFWWWWRGRQQWHWRQCTNAKNDKRSSIVTTKQPAERRCH